MIRARLRPAALALRRHRALWTRLGRMHPPSSLHLPETDIPRARFPVVDCHTHLGRWLSNGEWMEPDPAHLIDLMDELNVATLVNLDGRWDQELEQNLDRYDRRYPGRIASYCQLDWSSLTTARGFEQLATSLRRSHDAGARGIKVWKDLGLSAIDGTGSRVLHDDERLSELWATAGELNMPVLVHAADPEPFFQEPDESNERREELRWHPARQQRRLGPQGRVGIMSAFERVVRDNPGTTFIGAHMASRVEDLTSLGDSLQRYPNLHVDISARLGDLGRQPRAFTALLRAHGDRVLFGTDVYPVRADEYRIYLRFLETADEDFAYWAGEFAPLQGRWRISGVDLDEETLRAVYSGNAGRVLGLGPDAPSH